eukprot:3382443-Pleurochrysis_carterae.AAC.2
MPGRRRTGCERHEFACLASVSRSFDRRRDSHGYRQCASRLSTVRLRKRVVLWSQCSDGLSDMVIHVRGVSRRATGGPASVGRFDAATLSDVCGMCAAQSG